MVTNPRRIIGLAIVLLAFASPMPTHAASAGNDYPTPEIVDYVLACMAGSGNDRAAMFKCSCNIDHVARRMPYSEYEKAATALNMQAGGALGGRVGLFRDPPELKQAIDALRKAQAEARRECSG